MPSRPDAAARRVGSSLAQHATRGMTRRDLWSGVDQGSLMGMEFVAAILTWTGIGWLVDRWLGTAPWLLVAGAVIGNSAGLYLVWLRSQRMDEAEAARRRPPAERVDEEGRTVEG